MENKSTYNPRLYTISKNISIRKNSDFSFDHPIAIHNSLLPFYQQLAGQYSLEKTAIEYTMPIIDLDSTTNDELEKLCEFYLDYMRNYDANSNVRKVKSNLNKIDLSTDTQLIDKAMECAEIECNKTVQHENNNVEYYKKYYAYYQQTARANILNWEKEYRKSLNEFSLKHIFMFRRFAFKKIFSSYECKEIENDFAIWKNHYRTLLYIDISCWIILQVITFSLTKKDFKINVKSIQYLSRELDDIQPKMLPVKCSENIFMTYSEFLLFAIFRTHFLADSTLLKRLQDTCTDIQNPSPKYSLFTEDGKPKRLSPEEQFVIYLEGTKKDKRTFQANIKMCEDFIPLYNMESGRKLQINDITLKAIYRQLILEKSVQHKQQSKTIVSNFIKNKKFNNFAEYYFINEKINMGMFREYGLINEFFIKNEFQEKLYTYVNILLTRLNPSSIFHEAQETFNKIFSNIEKLLSEDEHVTVSVEDIEKFLLTVNFVPLDEPKPEKHK